MRPHLRRDFGQRWAGLGLRARTRGRRDRDLQPFWPAYLTAERIAKAPELKLAITAGIGSDHVDLAAAIERGITVTEITYSNSISVSEHVVMMILSLLRNYIPSYQWVVRGGWNIADCVARSYDLEGMQVGTVAAGRIGSAVLRRLKPFDVGLHYTDRHRLPEEVERDLGVTFHPDAESMVPVCDVVTINAPLHPETEHLPTSVSTEEAPVETP
jgi:formate dehydrogenase